MKYLIWDFDGTLAYRIGMWSGTLVEILRREVPECDTTVDDIRPYLRRGFPWHSPEYVYPPNQPADAWWNALAPVFEEAFRRGAGLSTSEAQRLARQVRHVYVDLERWRLFEDSVPCLHRLGTQGWAHIVLSNHVPELRDIIRALGLAPYISSVFNSAETGLEKPHPQAFQNVLDTLGDVETICMVGDNIIADIAGAKAVGLPAVLVRRNDPQAEYCAENLTELSRLLERLS